MSHDIDKDLQAKLDELKAKRAAASEKMEAARARRDLEDAVAREERALREDQVFAELYEQHGSKIKRLDTDAGMVVIKAPHHVIYRKFHDAGDTSAAALEKLTKSCLVYPSRDQFDLIVEEKPAVLVVASNAVIKMAGLRLDETAKKSNP